MEAWYESLWRRSDAEEAGKLAEYLEEEEQLAERARRVARELRVRYHAAELENMAAYMTADVRSLAMQVTVPSLVLHGEYDRVVPSAWGAQLSRTIPTAQLAITGSSSTMRELGSWLSTSSRTTDMGGNVTGVGGAARSRGQVLATMITLIFSGQQSRCRKTVGRHRAASDQRPPPM